MANSRTAALAARLGRLRRDHRIVFAASCCERLFPNYLAFYEAEGWGDPKILRSALDEVWSHALGKHLSIQRIPTLIQQTDRVIPDTEDFRCPFTSAALDAGTAIIVALQCAANGSADSSAEAAEYAVDTIDMYIQARDGLEPSDQAIENTIEHDPLMQAELFAQDRDLRALEEHGSLTRELVNEMRSRSSLEGLQRARRSQVS